MFGHEHVIIQPTVSDLGPFFVSSLVKKNTDKPTISLQSSSELIEGRGILLTIPQGDHTLASRLCLSES